MVDGACITGQKVMGWAEQRLRKLFTGLPEDRRYWFFVSADVAVEVYEVMENYHFLPPDPKFVHYLWVR